MKNLIQLSSFLFFILYPSILIFAQCQVGEDIAGENSNDFFGAAVSLSMNGSRLAVGAPINSDNGFASGHIRVFDFLNDSWTQVGESLMGQEDDRLGAAVSLSADGNTLAAGASNNGDNGANSGQVRVFTFDGTSWQQIGNAINGEAAEDRSGSAVSLSADGSIVAIGAWKNGGTATNAGHVRVYQLNSGTWTQLGSDLDGAAFDDKSGRAISLSSDGSRLAIGASNNDGNGSNSGHVRVYDFLSGNWIQVGDDIEGAMVGERSGGAVSLSSDGNRLAIGAPSNDQNGNGSGQTKVYDYTGSSWQQVGNAINGAAAGDVSGSSVSLSADGNRLAIGEPESDLNGTDSGLAFIYDLIDDVWVANETNITGQEENDRLGARVTLSSDGNRIALGAVQSAQNGTDSGQSRVYDVGINYETQTISSCTDYIWIDGNTYTQSNNTASFTLLNSFGCDSVFLLDLTITSLDASITNNGPTLTANTAGATYQWVDCDNAFSPLAGETNQSFTATTNGVYALIISQNACVDTSECVALSTVSVLNKDFEKSIKIFPNPTTGQVQIDLGESFNEVNIKIKNVLGQVVSSTSHASLKDTRLAVKDGPGVYFVEVWIAGNQVKLYKLYKL